VKNLTPREICVSGDGDLLVVPIYTPHLLYSAQLGSTDVVVVSVSRVVRQVRRGSTWRVTATSSVRTSRSQRVATDAATWFWWTRPSTVDLALAAVSVATSATSAAWSMRYGFSTGVARGNHMDVVSASWTRICDNWDRVHLMSRGIWTRAIDVSKAGIPCLLSVSISWAWTQSKQGV